MEIFSPKIVSKFPVIAGILFFSNSLSQIIRIWINHSSKDQSLIGWISLTITLWILLIFYKICCPKEHYMFWSTVVEILVNLFLILSILMFK